MAAQRVESRFTIARIRMEGSVVILDVEGVGDQGCCPACGSSSMMVHGRYRRQPFDLPWRKQVVRLHLTVRRFRCLDPACTRVTFAEDFGSRLLRYARRTSEATALLLEVALAAGGAAGARLAQGIGLPVSPDTLLRLLRRTAPSDVPTPRVLGVDDFALRRGHRYGTILLDLETHRPIDLLADREAATLAAWLREHPGVEILARDRSGAYAEGGRQGAGDILQVADRFHLAQNASVAMEDLLRGSRRSLEYAAPPDPAASALVDTRPPSPTALRQQAGRTARLQRFTQARALLAAGMPKRRIAREVDVSVRTIQRWGGAVLPPPSHGGSEEEPARLRPGGLSSPTLQPYAAYLQERWTAGCSNASQLHREVCARGYTGSYTLLAQALRAWRPSRPPPKQRRQANVRWLCLRPRAQLKEEERQALDRLLEHEPALGCGYGLLHRFRALIAARDVQALDGWLTDAQQSELPSFIALANGIRGDLAAVEAALTTSWSTGPVEGHIHRLKLIKRQGYGRAKLDLLRRRVVAA